MKRLFSYLLFFQLVTIQAQNTDVKAHFTNNGHSKEYGTFEKVEIGVELPAVDQQKIMHFLMGTRVPNGDKVNPFLAWDLDVQGVFTHVESNKTIVVPAFFYRDFRRDTLKNEYVAIDVKDNMRIRFAAPLPGDWTCSINYKVKQKPQTQTADLKFSVVDSGKKGFIKVHENQRNLVQNEQLIYPVGTNFPFPTKGVNQYHTTKDEYGKEVFDPFTTTTVTKPKSFLKYYDDIANFKLGGGKFFRIILSPWNGIIEFEVKGNYFNRLHYAWEQDSLLNFCEANDMYYSFNMMLQSPFMKYGDYDTFDWDWYKYRRDGSIESNSQFPVYCYSDGLNKEPHDMFMNEMDLLYHEQRVRYYLARYSYSTNIYMFELLSEPWHLDQLNEEVVDKDTKEGEVARKAVLNYHNRIAKYIKTELPCVNQLIGIDVFLNRIYDGDKYIDSSIYSPYIDVVGYNPYTCFPEKYIISKSGDNNVIEPNENSMYHAVNILYSKSKKPIMIFEGGPGDGVDELSNYAQQRIDMMSFPFIGLAGFNSWIGWYHGHETVLYNIVASEDFTNSSAFSDVLFQSKGNWIQGRQMEKKYWRDKKSSKELQYYISEEANMSVGYVKNRTYNYYTQATDSSLHSKFPKDLTFSKLVDVTYKNGKDLVIEGLKKGKTVEIVWYAFDTGKEFRRDIVKSKKNLVLKHPDLIVTDPANVYPMFWFSLMVKD